MSLASLGPLLAGALYTWLHGPGTVLVFAAAIGLAALIVTFSEGGRKMREISATAA
jgi:hypothetical protein